MAETLFHYRKEGDVSLIEIGLDSVDQLFNSLDPSPFRHKDLDPDAEDYIVASVRDFALHAPLKIVFYLPAPDVDLPAARAIPDALHHYFAYSLESENRRLRAELRDGRTHLAIGLAFLFGCIGLRELIAVSEAGTLRNLVGEALLIFGWVAMWRPIDTFLYGWWPIRRRCRIFEKLTTMPVEVSAPLHR